MLQLDNTKRSTYSTCPRKYFLRHIKHLTPDTGSTALRFGSTWHALMEGYYSSIIKHGWNSTSADHIQAAIDLATETWEKESEGKIFYEDYRTLQASFESFLLYISTFQDDRSTMEILQSERLFKIRMELTLYEINKFPFLSEIELFFTGKLDLEVNLAGNHWIKEFKTTGQGAHLQAGRLNRSAQILGYTWAATHLGSDVTGVLTVVHQLTARKNKEGIYGKPTREFVRNPNVFSKDDLSAWRESFLYTAENVCKSIQNNFFPCQFDSCYQFGQCSFIRLCEQNRPFEELNLHGYIEEEWDVLKTGGSREDAQVIEG